MRLRVLNLDLFGHFAGKSYDFGAAGPDTPDFHIIYGPNEAGKTTTMEAYLRLLYGFDAREAYDFQHQRKNLQVSGSFETAQGDLSLTRLPTRNASLTDAHGAPLPEAAIAAHLGGLGADDYRNLLCLDDDTIERGGEEIANSKGDIGRLLFSAAAGVSDLTAVLDGVDADANALFLKRSSKTQMAQLKKELAEVTARIKVQDVPASAYRKLRLELAAATGTENEISAERNALMEQLAQIKAQQNALPLLHKLDQLDNALAAMPDYPTHLDTSPEDLVQLLSAQNQATHDITRLTQAQDVLKAALAQVDVQPRQRGLGQDLEPLRTLHIRYESNAMDLPRRIRTLAEVKADMQHAAAALGATCAPEQLVVTQATLSELETARDTMRTTAHDLETALAEFTRLSERVTLAERAVRNDTPADDTAIGEILDRFAIDTFAPTYATARQAISSARRDLATAVAALSIGGQDFNDVPNGATSVTEIETIAQAHDALTRKITQTTDDLDQMRADHATLQAQITGLHDTGAIIDDAAAQAVRTMRDAAWNAHRTDMTDATADRFETALEKTDAAAAQRLAQASDLAQLRQLSQAFAQIAARIAQHEQRQSRLVSEHTDITAQLDTIAKDMGLASAPMPAAFAQWGQRVATAAHSAQHLRVTLQDHAATIAKADRLMAALGQYIAQDTPDFETLVTTARQRAKIAADQSADHKAKQQTLDDLRAEKAIRQDHNAKLTQAAQAAQARWENLVAKHLQNQIAADRLALSFEPLRSLREHDTHRSITARQVTSMQEDQAQFIAALGPLAAQHDIPAADPLAAFAALGKLAEHARTQDAEGKALCQKIADAADEMASAQQTLNAIAQQVADIGALFPAEVPTSSIDDLRQAVAGAHDALSARKDRDEIAAQITVQLGCDIDQARAILDGKTATALDAAAMQTQGDLDAVEQQYREASAARGAAARDLNAVTGDDSIAVLSERKATLELALQDTALRYVSLRAGHMLAQEAIRRYRDKHRSAMMEATQKAFSELTNGAYTALQTQAQGNSESLIAIDASGRAKHAQDMSKGTRFQLYLALRAAAYEQLADQGTCLPFFCDDIFETFDEARTKSACKMMARIGRRGQAIYLTHHQHVVDIARATCGDAVRVHKI